MSFDAWEASIRPSSDSLMHWGIPGMKHGRRRYQNEDGTWTRAGLEARRKREGFGERRIERKAAKYYESRIKKYRAKMNNANNSDLEAEYGKKLSLYVAKRNAANGLISKKEYRDMRKADREYDKEEKKLIKQEDRENRMAAKAERLAKKRANNVKYMSDEELRKRIDRLKLEKEYKDMKRSPLVDQGAKLVGKYIDYKNAQAQREIDLNKQKIEMARIKSETAKSKDRIKITANEAKKAKSETAKTKYDVKGGLKIARKKDLKQVKLDYKNSTIRGGIAKRINMALTSGKKQQYEALRKAKAETEVNAMKSEAARNLNNWKWEHDRYDRAHHEKVEERDRERKERKAKKAKS